MDEPKPYPLVVRARKEGGHTFYRCTENLDRYRSKEADEEDGPWVYDPREYGGPGDVTRYWHTLRQIRNFWGPIEILEEG